MPSVGQTAMMLGTQRLKSWFRKSNRRAGVAGNQVSSEQKAWRPLLLYLKLPPFAPEISSIDIIISSLHYLNFFCYICGPHQGADRSGRLRRVRKIRLVADLEK